MATGCQDLESEYQRKQPLVNPSKQLAEIKLPTDQRKVLNNYLSETAIKNDMESLTGMTTNEVLVRAEDFYRSK